MTPRGNPGLQGIAVSFLSLYKDRSCHWSYSDSCSTPFHFYENSAIFTELVCLPSVCEADVCGCRTYDSILYTFENVRRSDSAHQQRSSANIEGALFYSYLCLNFRRCFESHERRQTWRTTKVSPRSPRRSSSPSLAASLAARKLKTTTKERTATEKPFLAACFAVWAATPIIKCPSIAASLRVLAERTMIRMPSARRQRQLASCR
jgi:hypothetical protein